MPLWSILLLEDDVNVDDDDSEEEVEFELKNWRCRISISKEQLTRVRWLKGGRGMTEGASRTVGDNH